ncbi:MAG: hypothetical protein J7452_06200 [Thermoflexus sp.]|jgi:hypothetical protein|nr:hypothetical protein [Thermoflexus sp.]
MGAQDPRGLRVEPEAVREIARALRRGAREREALAQRARGQGNALGEIARAVPGEQFSAFWARGYPRWQRSAEHLMRMAEVLERAMDRLEEAFQMAARMVREAPTAESGALPFVPLALSPEGYPRAVDATGRPLQSQFEARVFTAQLLQLGVSEASLRSLLGLREGQPLPESIPWSTACGPVGLSMAASAVLGRSVPVEAAISSTLRAADASLQRSIREDIQARPGKGSLGFYTRDQDLLRAAGELGLRGEKVWMPNGERDSEGLWRSLRERLGRGEALMALVRIQEKRGLQVGDGLLTPYQASNSVSHWVAVQGLEEGPDGRYVVTGNPYFNRSERYRWEDFLAAVDSQARKARWWMLAFSKGESHSGGEMP